MGLEAAMPGADDKHVFEFEEILRALYNKNLINLKAVRCWHENVGDISSIS